MRFRRFRALPGLLAPAPRWAALVVGIALVVLGLLIVLRPITSLWLLAVYAGVSCIVSGLAELGRSSEGHGARWIRVAVSVIWVLAGVAIIVWLGFSIAVLPIVLAAMLVVGGVSELPRLRRGRASERVLIGAWGFAQVAFGVLALVWPDLTLVTVALLFGARTIVFGAGLVLRGVPRPSRAGQDDAHLTSGPGLARFADAARWVAAILVVAIPVGAWSISLDLRSGLPVPDAFYSTPSEVPGAPGALLRAEAWPGSWPERASVQRILYTTTDLHGDPAVASAIVVVPDDLPDAPAPVIIWDHGTTGIARDCAPSLMTDMFDIQGIPAVAQAIAAGWVIVASDYSGQGSEGDFPYLIGEGEARSALDGMRAARQIDSLNLAADAVIWGHSQGGHAALWTGAIAGDYAPELHILGVAAISPAADPHGLAERITSQSDSPVSALAVAWVLIPYSQAYDDVVFDAHVAPAGRAVVREMSARCTSQPGLLISVVSALGITAGDRLYLGDLTSGSLGDRLAENKTLGPWSMPLTIAWGGSDEVIAPQLQDGYVDELCAAGVTLTWQEYPEYSHMGIVQDGSEFLPRLVAWTSDRIAGAPAPASQC